MRNLIPVVVTRTGEVVLLYSEDLKLSDVGDAEVHRASHVDPGGDGDWWADLAPVQGPRLGPFTCRSQALAAETTWLTDQWLPDGGLQTHVIPQST